MPTTRRSAMSPILIALVLTPALAHGQTKPLQATLQNGCAFWVDPDQQQIEKVNDGLASSNPGITYLGARYGTGNDRPASDFVMDEVLHWDADIGEFRGRRPWQQMEIVDFRDNPAQRNMTVERVRFSGDNTLLGCLAELRQYVVEGVPHDRPIAPSMWFEPGDALSLFIQNDLPDNEIRLTAAGTEFGTTHGNHGLPASSSEFGYIPPLALGHSDGGAANDQDTIYNMIHDQNHTNIHTHGWHVDPKGNGDNVFVNIRPGQYHEQFVELPEDHPSGTHWYHAHKHGATAVQVSGGMAGTLIVTDQTKGLDTVPVVAGATDMLMAMQQITYDDFGEVEGIDFVQEDVRQTGAACDAGANFANRPIFINGVAAPTIQIRLGEIQRWRFVHTGSINDLNPQVVAVSGLGLDTLSPAGQTATNLQENGTPQGGSGAPAPDYDPITLPLYEISTDGLPTGQIIPKSHLNLSPAYRSDALFQVTQTQLDALGQYVGREQITHLYLVSSGQDQSGTSNPKQCVRDADGNLVLDADGNPITVRPNIMSARRVMAVIEILPGASAPEYDLADDYNSTEMTTAFAAARSVYETPAWGRNPEAPYEGIGPLAPVSDAELAASGKAHPDSNAIERVHYFGDAPNNAGRTKYHCPDSGGACTYCGGSTAEFEGTDGQIYSFTTATSSDPLCTTPRTPPVSVDIGADPADPYAAQDQLPFINFMVCDGFEDTTLAPSGQVKDPEGNPISGTPESVGYTGTASVWRCFEFTEDSAFVRGELLDSSNIWEVSSNGGAGHVFHIHVNPFNLAVAEAPDFFGNTTPAHTIWKDTLKAPATGQKVLSAQGPQLRTRYTVFSGAYVQHCHVLTHEDQGMMQVVSVTDQTALDRLTAQLGYGDEAQTMSYLSEVLYSDVPNLTSGSDLPRIEDVLPDPE